MCEFYANIYIGFNSALSTSTKLHTTLESALPKLYAAILVFSVKACQYLNAQCRVYLYVHVRMVLNNIRDQKTSKSTEAI